MLKEGVGVSVYFIPLHLHPYWRNQYHYAPHDFPVALDVFNRALSLPIYPKMIGDEIDRVIIAVKKILTY